MIELLVSPWTKTFYEVINLAEKELLIASPFLSNHPLNKIIEIITTKELLSTLRLNILTNLAVDSLLSGSLDIASLLNLAQSVPNSSVTYLPGLHAKIYIADSKAAFVTSANLTNNGLAGNYEYGVLLREPALISKVRNDLTGYAALGNIISLDTLTALNQATQELKAVRKQLDKSINTKLKADFEGRVESAKVELFKARASGKTTHSIFCDTIVYLLGQKGSLTTVDLHPLIQQIHPDLCDNSVEKIIGGVHFGKKWKHHVRSAQASLKRKDIIRFDGHSWSLKI